MRRLLFVFIALLGMTLQSRTQEPFTVKPAPFKKYVKVANGVNLRQKPTTQSPRLVWEEEEFGESHLIWSSGRLNLGQSVARADVLPIWKEVDDWYEGQYVDTKVYVMKRYCSEVRLRPLSKSLNDYYVIPSGKYKDYCIYISEIEGGFELLLGKYIDGMYTFPYRGFIDAHNENASSINGDHISMNKKYANEWGEPSLEKIVQDTRAIEFLMTNTNTMQHYSLYLFGIEGDTFVHRFSGVY